jgi:hypothetical protein
MDGIAQDNFPAFNDAQAAWRAWGHEAITPFDTNTRVWERVHDTPFVPGVTKCHYGDPLLPLMFAEDVAELAKADATVVLDGWERSKGTRVELILCVLLGKPVFAARYPGNVTTVKLPAIADLLAPVRAVQPETILEEAQRLVHGNRGNDYGHPIHDYRATGRMWSALLERWLKRCGLALVTRAQLCKDELVEGEERLPDIPPRLATLMMIAVKLSREAHQHKRDNLTDTAGYAECASMIAELEEAK